MSKTDKNQDTKAFLRELTKLTKKFNIEIAGCGCCGSPYLTKLTSESKDGQYTVTESGDALTWTND